MSLHARYNGQWHPILDLRVKYNNVWTNVQAAWVRHNNAWYQYYNRLPASVTYIYSSTQTITAPTGYTRMTIERMIGGGGGGGASLSGGGGGGAGGQTGYLSNIIISSGEKFSFVAGAGGAGAVYLGGNATDGAATTCLLYTSPSPRDS